MFKATILSDNVDFDDNDDWLIGGMIWLDLMTRLKVTNFILLIIVDDFIDIIDQKSTKITYVLEDKSWDMSPCN